MMEKFTKPELFNFLCEEGLPDDEDVGGGLGTSKEV